MNALLALLGLLAAFLGGVFVMRRSRPAPPTDSNAHAERDAAVRQADAARDTQKAQPLTEWVNGRFGRR